MSENSEIITNLPLEEDNTSEIEIDLNEIERKLDKELNVQLSDLDLLEEDKEKIGNPKAVGETVLSVVWDQFINQVGVIAGEDFVKENRGLKLDLSKDAHIQTTENFAEGKIATHNTEIDYQQRYDDWQSNFQKDENDNIVTHKTRSGNEEPILIKDARKAFDKGRPTGSAEKHTDMDHTVSAAEIIRDPEANAHMTKDEQISFANSDANLIEMDLSLNRSKRDKSISEWLDNPNSSGQKPDEIFDISQEEQDEMRQKDQEAREEYEKQKKEAEKRSQEAGERSRKDEALRIGGKALRTVLMGLLAELIRNIVNKLISWLRSGNKSFRTFIDQVKAALRTFVFNIKRNILTAGNTLVTTIATAIVGPVVGTIKKAWILIKQGAKSVKEAIDYINNPENKGKSLGILMLEVGKIVMAGLTVAGAMVLGEVIEKGLLSIPGFAFEIPLLGSLATILGMFLGALVSGIIGALVLNLIDRIIANKQKEQNATQQIDKRNDILATQSQLVDIKIEQFCETKMTASQSIAQRHQAAAQSLKEALETIYPDNGTKATGETI